MLFYYGRQEQYGKTEYIEALNNTNRDKYEHLAGWAVVLVTTRDNRENIDTIRITKSPRWINDVISGIKFEYKALFVYFDGKDIRLGDGDTGLKAKILAPFRFKLGSTQTTGLEYKKFVSI